MFYQNINDLLIKRVLEHILNTLIDNIYVIVNNINMIFYLFKHAL